MTANAKQNFEAGTVGSPVATGSAGGGNSAVTNIGTAPVITSAKALSDTQSADCIAPAGAQSAQLLPYVPSTTAAGFSWQQKIVGPLSTYAVDESLGVYRAGGANRVAVRMQTGTGKLILNDATSGDYVSSAALPLDTTLIFELLVDSGTSTTDGKEKVRVRKASDLSLVAGLTDWVERTGRNTGAGAIGSGLYTGLMSSTGTSARESIVDEINATDSYNSPISTSNTPPTVTGPSTTSVTGTTASITFTATDTTGTVSSFACVHQSNTAASTVTPTVGSPTLTGIGTGSATATFPITGLTANARYFFGGTATDSTGATSTTPVIARVDVTSTAPALRPGTTTTGYTIVGGGTATQALSAGTPNTRNLQSAAPAAGSTGSATFEPLPPGAVPVAFSVTGHATDATTSLTRTVRLYQSTTLIATRTGTINPTTDTTIGGTTNTSETAAITDRSGLRVDWVVS